MTAVLAVAVPFFVVLLMAWLGDRKHRRDLESDRLVLDAELERWARKTSKGGLS